MPCLFVLFSFVNIFFHIGKNYFHILLYSFFLFQIFVDFFKFRIYTRLKLVKCGLPPGTSAAAGCGNTAASFLKGGNRGWELENMQKPPGRHFILSG